MPIWLDKARTYLGLKEIPGPKTNATIQKWWSLIRAPFTDDETPWCAAFVGGVLEECGVKSSRAASARSYLKWGQVLQSPIAGAIVVFWRGKPDGWSGHVGFVVGKDQAGNLMVIGGNQGDTVTIAPFNKSRVLGYRWPEGVPAVGHMPTVLSNGKLSDNEA